MLRDEFRARYEHVPGWRPVKIQLILLPGMTRNNLDKIHKILTTLLDNDDLVRIDILAQGRGLSRTQMFMVLVRAGIAACEQKDGLAVCKRDEVCKHDNAPPISQRRPKAP
jgi:hypothetical protein